jgi:tetraacyldisaccharide 4'-kinase
MDWSKIHQERGVRPISLPLAFLSVLYGLGVRLRAGSYEKRGKYRLPGFTLSIGNITAGGTGKTPAVLMVAKWAVEQGFRPVVLSRGYGGRYPREVLEVSDGKEVKAGPAEAGDEPILMAESLPGVPIVVSRKRHLAGQYASERFNSDFFLLDDGFQHLRLARDLDLVLLDAGSPFGNGRLLPWGPLREPIGGLGRASGFVLTRSNDTRRERNWLEYVTRRFPGKPVFRAAHVPEKVVIRGECHESAFLKGKRVFAFAGIANPSSFRRTLIDAGADPVGFRIFRDHHPFSESEVRGLVSLRASSGADLLITTEKDWVRLERFSTACPDLARLTVTMKILDREERFFELLKENFLERRRLRP